MPARPGWLAGGSEADRSRALERVHEYLEGVG
jgi:hypothetical protein